MNTPREIPHLRVPVYHDSVCISRKTVLIDVLIMISHSVSTLSISIIRKVCIFITFYLTTFHNTVYSELTYLNVVSNNITIELYYNDFRVIGSSREVFYMKYASYNELTNELHTVQYSVRYLQ